MILFKHIEAGALFMVPGTDDIWRKIASDRAKNLGCSFLKSPTRLGRKNCVDQFNDDVMILVFDEKKGWI